MSQLTSLITQEDGQSHFVDVELSYKKRYPQWDVNVSNSFLIEHGDLVIWPTIENFELRWVNPPRKQFIIYLSGIVEIEIGSGEKRQFKKGDVLYAADCEGQGHITRIIEPMTAAVISSTDQDN